MAAEDLSNEKGLANMKAAEDKSTELEEPNTPIL